MEFNYYNPFSKFFLDSKYKQEEEREIQGIKNAQGISTEDYEFFGSDGSNKNMAAFGLNNTQALFKTSFTNKQQKISLYREMANFPEIKDAIDTICDEAITSNEDGKYVDLLINKELPAREERFIRKTFEYVVNDVLKFHKNGWEYFRRWLIESELFLEMVLNNDGNKIIRVRALPAAITQPVYEGTVIRKYIQSPSVTTQTNSVGMPSQTEGKVFAFESNQITYVNYGEYGNTLLDVRGYLEATIRTYNQLKSLEDAVIIYRLVRAPERRIWNVNSGKQPQGKAAEFLKNLIHSYRKNDIYNQQTGQVDSTKAFQALTQDYWFLKDSDGRGTEVTTLQSGMNLGELDDVNYFLRKLYKTLNIPRSRWEDTMNTVATGMAPGEITREELKFSKFVNRLRTKFSRIIIDVMVQQLRLSNQVDQKYTKESLFNIKYFEENAFAEQKKLQVLKAKVDVLSQFTGDIASADNPTGLWSRKYVMQEVWGMNDQQYQEIRTQIAEELAEEERKANPPEKEEKKKNSKEDEDGNEDGSKEAKSEVPVQEVPPEQPEDTPASVAKGEGGESGFPEP